VAHLAKAERDRLAQMPPEERAKRIESLRQQERERRAEWQVALRQQEVVLPPRVRFYVEKSLMPTLSHQERDELRKAASRSWPEYVQQLTDLAKKHPILVPPGEKPGVMSFKD